MTSEPDYIVIETWPSYNNLNRVYLGGGDLSDSHDTMRTFETTVGIGETQ